MKRFLYTLLIGLLFNSLLPAQNSFHFTPRKKVGVVLSGGGAKGAAHVNALKVIEEAGIPIDYIVGTSMGSLVGALYSIGYTTEQLDSLLRSQDWKYLLTDAYKADKLSLSKRMKSDQYVLSVPFKKTPADAISGGMIAGRNLAELFSDLTEGYHDSISFRKLPIPFACVSYDITKGKEFVFYDGKLPLAMRASMSIPGVFNPVKWNNKVLVDGGLSDNYPVDIARKMGADVVIGVDVQDTLVTANQLNSLSEVLGQIINILCANKYEENVKNTDVHIKVNTSGYSAASFSAAAIDTLLNRGEVAAREKWDELITLKRKIGLPSNYQPKKRATYVPPAPSYRYIKEIHPGNRPSNTLAVGIRFDNEQLASLLFNTTLSLSKKTNDQLDVTLKLGKSVKFRADFVTHPFKTKGNIIFGYQYDYNDINMYSGGSKIVNYSYNHHTFEAKLVGNWRNIALTAGLRGEAFDYSDFLMPQDLDVPLEDSGNAFISYFGSMVFSSLDKRSFPTKGMKWDICYSLYTDNLYQYKKQDAVSTIEASWMQAIMLNSRLMMEPKIYGRAVFTNHAPLSVLNFIGGEYYGRYYPQQMPFIGVNDIEHVANKALIGGMRFRQRITTNQYVLLTGNIGYFGDDLNYKVFKDTKFGVGISYAYDTFIGPLTTTLSWSNITKSIGFYLGIGYNF